VPRTGNQIEASDLQILTVLGAQIAIAPLNTPPISSTIIRQSYSIEGLTPKVAQYIQHHHLYANSDESKQIK
jgi:nicotinic acid mononucleotide adenylyltransferase